MDTSNKDEYKNEKQDTNKSSQITQEMEQYFDKRTKEHIDRVVNNMTLMVGYKGFDKETLSERGTIHDKSKLSKIEKEGYIWLTWWHYCRKQGIEFSYPEGVEDLVKASINHHLLNNLHHPESHPDVNQMSELDVVEMVCDWTAMSQEYNQKSCLAYVNSNINKWGFSDSKKEIIYEAITEIDKRLEQELLKQ